MKAHKCNLVISLLSYFASMDAARVIEEVRIMLSRLNMQ